MHMFTSNPHLMSEFSRQRHKDLMRQAQQWRLLQEAQRAQQLEPNPRRPSRTKFPAELLSAPLRATLATAATLLRRLAPQPAPSNKQTAPC